MVDTLLLSDSLPRILWIFTEQLLQRTPLVEFFWLLRSYCSLKILLFSFSLSQHWIHCISSGLSLSSKIEGLAIIREGGAEVAKKIIDWGVVKNWNCWDFFQKTESILSFWIRGTCVTQRKFENQGFITEVTKISALINDWENIIAYWEESKQSKALVDKCGSLHTKNGFWVWGVGSAAPEKLCNLYPHLSLETVFPALKLTQNCYLH